jgi:hypothetical protein
MRIGCKWELSGDPRYGFKIFSNSFDVQFSILRLPFPFLQRTRLIWLFRALCQTGFVVRSSGGVLGEEV